MQATDKEKKFYVFQKFEVSAHYNSRIALQNNTIGRIRNTIAAAINEKWKLPKMIAIILEADVINYVNYNDWGVSDLFGRLVDHLMKEVRKMIDIFKEKLPDKASKEGWPHITWIAPVVHEKFHAEDNQLRKKFTGALETMVLFQKNMSVLKLFKVWDTKDLSLVVGDKFTAVGQDRYWAALDRTLRFADKIYFKDPEELAEKTRAENEEKWRNDKLRQKKENEKKWGFDDKNHKSYRKDDRKGNTIFDKTRDDRRRVQNRHRDRFHYYRREDDVRSSDRKDERSSRKEESREQPKARKRLFWRRDDDDY